MLKKIRQARQEQELDITSFMSLMIVLVPVLLMMMVFSHITILELKLPSDIDEISAAPNDELKNLELLVGDKDMALYYPQGALLKTIPATDDGQLNYPLLVQALKEVKYLLNEKGIEKKDINLLLPPATDYQTIVTVMDSVRSYKAVVAASVVDAELFPDVSLSDAPEDLLAAVNAVEAAQ
ncbi:biopolymer transporter ExbD [Psychrobium sp. MM17-31]|uniref:ExbD/TolR family protein n=1 Tax=Psychrobium sp. MM17-31 TaxID=2917758 RepID=UPI001EF5133F|nr:biopolymer transporter ExbD [Psychrobium sp. MM17-31]MCG7529886.1 biopolymer transporter ExbD [Psychrobium sp. MM17-31]